MSHAGTWGKHSIEREQQVQGLEGMPGVCEEQQGGNYSWTGACGTEWEEMRPVRGNKDQTVSMQGLVGHCEAKLGC